MGTPCLKIWINHVTKIFKLHISPDSKFCSTHLFERHIAACPMPRAFALKHFLSLALPTRNVFPHLPVLTSVGSSVLTPDPPPWSALRPRAPSTRPLSPACIGYYVLKGGPQKTSHF